MADKRNNAAKRARKAAKKAAPKKASPKKAAPKKAASKAPAKSAKPPPPAKASQPKASGSELPPTDENGVAINRFFQQISTSVIAAQKELDSQSKDYLAHSAGKPHVPPTVFRMPKVKASIRFAFTKGKDEGLNLLLFRSGQSTTHESEQSIDFEIVSAPTSPDAQHAISQSLPKIPLLLEPGARAKAIGLLTTALGSAHHALHQNALNRLVILPGASEDSFLAIAATKTEPRTFSAWQGDLKAGTASLIFENNPISLSGPNAILAPVMELLKGYLVSLQDQQETLLDAFGS